MVLEQAPGAGGGFEVTVRVVVGGRPHSVVLEVPVEALAALRDALGVMGAGRGIVVVPV